MLLGLYKKKIQANLCPTVMYTTNYLAVYIAEYDQKGRPQQWTNSKIKQKAYFKFVTTFAIYYFT